MVDRFLKNVVFSNAVNVIGVDSIFESYGNGDEKGTDDI